MIKKKQPPWISSNIFSNSFLSNVLKNLGQIYLSLAQILLAVSTQSLYGYM